jgi:hypothetical protein
MPADLFNFLEERNLWILTSKRIQRIQRSEIQSPASKRVWLDAASFWFRLVIITVSPAY